MKKTLSKKAIQEKVKLFFADLSTKNSDDIHKIKRLAMTKNVQLKDYRKSFCKKCLTPYKDPKLRIKGSHKTITCPKCGHISRWKLK